MSLLNDEAVVGVQLKSLRRALPERKKPPLVLLRREVLALPQVNLTVPLSATAPPRQSNALPTNAVYM